MLFESECYVDSYLKELSDNKKLLLCEVAKRAAATIKNIEVIFEKSELKPPQIYKIVYHKNEEERVALECPTKPPMMVQFQNLRVNKDVKVILFQNNESQDT